MVTLESNRRPAKKPRARSFALGAWLAGLALILLYVSTPVV
jgi:hypothetical protein